MLALGQWTIHSESDPRWNKSGEATVGGFSMCPEAREWVKECEKNFGEMPDDTTHSYMKY